MTTATTPTKSELIFDTLRANRKRGAKIEQLTEATGLPISYMGSYMAEFKRVYGANVEYSKKSERYKLKNIKEVRAAFAARKAGKKVVAAAAASQEAQASA